jgi:hypothetical protein
MTSKKKSTSKPKAAKPAEVKAPKAEASAKATSERRNDIPHPRADSICGSVWAFLDANPKASANDVIAGIKGIKGIKGINEATARTQAQRYKKFHA